MTFFESHLSCQGKKYYTFLNKNKIFSCITKPENKQCMFLVLLYGVKQNHIQILLFDDYNCTTAVNCEYL
ncbi:MAG: hypothetical protein HZB65_03555 [Candidatus Aenigmarchaeota archaeon]|nr:hypothetical protein [Candidatus Aenigmarchaeota archaeon]